LVAHLWCTWIPAGCVIVAVAALARPTHPAGATEHRFHVGARAIHVGIPVQHLLDAFVDRAVAIVVAAIAGFHGRWGHRLIRVVAVTATATRGTIGVAASAAHVAIAIGVDSER
jgi:hypothetical protein